MLGAVEALGDEVSTMTLSTVRSREEDEENEDSQSTRNANRANALLWKPRYGEAALHAVNALGSEGKG